MQTPFFLLSTIMGRCNPILSCCMSCLLALALPSGVVIIKLLVLGASLDFSPGESLWSTLGIPSREKSITTFTHYFMKSSGQSLPLLTIFYYPWGGLPTIVLPLFTPSFKSHYTINPSMSITISFTQNEYISHPSTPCPEL